MKHLFIINPAAGKEASTRRLEELLSGLTFPHEIVYTREAGDAQRITEQAAAEGVPVRIYACGGDGTLNEVVNGAAGHDHVAITNIPKGTGNDFLKIFGKGYRESFYRLEELSVGPQVPFDLIDCNGKLGIDMVCCGVDARIGHGVHRYKRLQFISGMGAYILALLEHVLFRGITRPMSVRMGDIAWDGQTTILCICNGRYYGGGFNPMPEAMPDDGVLDALLIPGISLLALARYIGRYSKGRYREVPKYIWPYHGNRITFSSEEEILVVVDGETMWGKEFLVRLSEKKVNFFYPASVSYCVEENGVRQTATKF